jgi:putative ABC transport system substrate-binding protein
MRDHGRLEGRDYVLEWRCADGKYDRLPGFAAELVRLKVDVIVAPASPAIRAAQKATAAIPIVFPNTGDPVGSGFVASLARPGGNITGLSNAKVDASAKQLELLLTLDPKLPRVAVLGNPGSSTHQALLKSIQTDAQAEGIRVLTVEACTPEEIERAFGMMAQESAGAVIVAADAFLGTRWQQIASLAIRNRLKSITQQREYAEAGGLMSYGQDFAANYRRAAAYVVKILNEASPAYLPVEEPTKLELVVNLRTAKTLGLTIPPSVLMRADEVIE